MKVEIKNAILEILSDDATVGDLSDTAENCHIRLCSDCIRRVKEEE